MNSRMNVKTHLVSTVLLLVLTGNAIADTYSTFQTKRFYSANRRYFIEVTEKKHATLYRNGRQFRRIWTRILPELPRELFVLNNGSGVAMVDFYYGNNSNPKAPVVIVFGVDGSELARYLLKDVADLSRTPATTSMSDWYRDAKLATDEHALIIQTSIAKYDRSKCGNINSPDEADKMWKICIATVPHENLVFNMATGRLISRENVASR